VVVSGPGAHSQSALDIMHITAALADPIKHKRDFIVTFVTDGF